MTKQRTRLALAMLFVLALPAQAPAQQTAPATPQAAPQTQTPQTLDEVVVTGRRPVVPDMTEDYLYHKQEYERLRSIYVQEPEQRFSAGERKLRMPEAVSATQIGRPTLMERTD